ncbi:hypothetical protein P280DRAFT_517110 [Massarina eburnea CBS 473.64]|uniref:Condensation domain-containing protein n=1 Tax=Massarina eburnea CBS 473.64 TaxID=1395130 RepID=A0A6A6S2K4_9PLEO|nr:hypothetical protein P280DRAFT_517110 [Massarina eburnea CBS 473.64]
MEHIKIQSAEEVVAEYGRMRAHEFDLESGSLFRMVLLTLSPTTHYLLFNAHHIIMDVTSFQIPFADMDKDCNGEALGPQPRQYLDFYVAQRQALDEEQFIRELDSYRRIFPIEDPPPILPLLPMVRSSSTAQVKSVAKANRSTPFHVYLAAFKAMLFCFTDVDDLTIGIVDDNSNDSDLIEAIVEARDTAYTELEYSSLPFDVLLKELKMTRSSSQQMWVECQFDVEDYHPGRSGYDISLDVADLGPEVQIALCTQRSFYDVTATTLLLKTYLHFVDVLSRDTSLSVEDTPLFSEEQFLHSLAVGYEPYMSTDRSATLPHRIDLIVVKNADKIA